MIVETTNYYAHPGRAEEVLEHRKRGNAVRAALGLHPGRIFVKVSGDGPDVRWECAFPSKAAFDADLAARDKSAEFAAQRQGMRTLVERFERHVEEEVEE